MDTPKVRKPPLLPEGVKENPYVVLKVTRASSGEEIRASFKEIAGRDHPDRNADDEAAKARFLRASTAFSLIGTPSRRKAFDELMTLINAPVKASPPPKGVKPKPQPKPEAKAEKPKPARSPRPPRGPAEKLVWEVADPWTFGPPRPGADSNEVLATLATETALRQGPLGTKRGPIRIEVTVDGDMIHAVGDSLNGLRELDRAIRSASQLMSPLFKLFK